MIFNNNQFEFLPYLLHLCALYCKTAVKQSDETDRAKTYADISAQQPKVRRQRPKTAEEQRQKVGPNKDPPLPQLAT